MKETSEWLSSSILFIYLFFWSSSRILTVCSNNLDGTGYRGAHTNKQIQVFVRFFDLSETCATIQTLRYRSSSPYVRFWISHLSNETSTPGILYTEYIFFVNIDFAQQVLRSFFFFVLVLFWLFLASFRLPKGVGSRNKLCHMNE